MSNLLERIKEASAYKKTLNLKMNSSNTPIDYYENFLRDELIRSNIALEADALPGIADACDYVFKIAKNPDLAISEEIVNHLYYILFDTNRSSCAEIACNYYRSTLYISPSGFTASDASEIPHLMSHYANQIYTSSFSLHPIELGAFAHKRLIDIRPFPNGNEIIARMILTIILLHDGYPPFILPISLLDEYKNSLELAHNVIYIEDYMEFMANCIIKTQMNLIRDR